MHAAAGRPIRTVGHHSETDPQDLLCTYSGESITNTGELITGGRHCADSNHCAGLLPLLGGCIGNTNTNVSQCDFRFDLFFSFSFSFPVMF